MFWSVGHRSSDGKEGSVPVRWLSSALASINLAHLRSLSNKTDEHKEHWCANPSDQHHKKSL